jgi:hypothetical protein
VRDDVGDEEVEDAVRFRIVMLRVGVGWIGGAGGGGGCESLKEEDECVVKLLDDFFIFLEDDDDKDVASFDNWRSLVEM